MAGRGLLRKNYWYRLCWAQLPAIPKNANAKEDPFGVTAFSLNPWPKEDWYACAVFEQSHLARQWIAFPVTVMHDHQDFRLLLPILDFASWSSVAKKPWEIIAETRSTLGLFFERD